MLINILNNIEKCIRIVLSLLLFLSVFVIGYQVAMRYIFDAPPAWSEELARYCNVTITMFGAALAMRYGGHISLDFLESILPKKVQQRLNLLNYIICTIFFILLAYSGYLYMVQAGNQSSPGLRISMYLPYAVIPTSALLGIVFSLEALNKNIGGEP